MMKNSYFFLKAIGLFLLIPKIGYAQQNFPRDTSYTTRSAYNKYVKSFPDISIVKPVLPAGVDEKRDVAYKNTGTRNLQLDIFKPSRESKSGYPAILMVHGGGWISGDKSLLAPLAMQLAEQEYVTVTVEYRLSPEATYPAAVYDLNSALNWIQEHAEAYDINPEKIGILGSSAGGQLVALVGAASYLNKFNDSEHSAQTVPAIKVIVDIDGVLAFIHPESEEGTVASKWLGGSENEAREIWIEASALTYAGEETPPILFIGSSNPRFLAGRKDMITVLEQNDIYSETHLFENAPHSFWLFDPWFEPTKQFILSFLNQVLK